MSSRYVTNYYLSSHAGTANTFSGNYSWTHPDGPKSYVGNWPVRPRRSADFRQHPVVFSLDAESDRHRRAGERGRTTGLHPVRALSRLDRLRPRRSPPPYPTDGGRPHRRERLLQGESEHKFSPLHGDSMVSGLGIIGVDPNAYAVQGFPTVTIAGLTGLSMVYDGGITRTSWPTTASTPSRIRSSGPSAATR